MANPLSRLLHPTRRMSRRDESPAVGAAMAMAGGGIEDADAGPPPVLRPAAIFRQVLFDPAELTPAWLRPRPAPEAAPATPSSVTIDETAPADVPPTDAPKAAKRTRRPKSEGAARPPRPRSRRVAKQDPAADDR